MLQDKILKTEIFIKKSKKIHGNKYDYSKVNYTNAKTKVCIICPEHGEFWQLPYNHLQGKGCLKCGGRQKITTQVFIERAKKINGGKYDYSKINYINNKTPVCIICPKHGEFWQEANSHLQGHGCPKCSNNKKSTNKEFIERAKKVHGNIYDYSKVEYVNEKVNVCIICPKHGEFWQRPDHHLDGTICPKCKTEKLSKYFASTKEEFIQKARKIHGDKYDYSKVNYVNKDTKVCIICPEHGEFWQTPHVHLNGHGCPKCKSSSMEDEVANILMQKEIIFEQEKTFDWLKYKNLLRLDFFIPKYKLAIECQGVQHFKPIDFAGKGKEWAKNLFDKSNKRDKIKFSLCEKNGINIEYINYNEKVYDKLIKILYKYDTISR